MIRRKITTVIAIGFTGLVLATGCGNGGGKQATPTISGKVAVVSDAGVGCNVTLQPDAGQTGTKKQTFKYLYFCNLLKVGTPYRIHPNERAAFQFDQTVVVTQHITTTTNCALTLKYVDMSGSKPVDWSGYLYDPPKSIQDKVGSPTCKGYKKGSVYKKNGPQWTQFVAHG